MVTFHVFAIKVYIIGLPFTQTLAHDQSGGLLIAFPNEKYCLFLFPDSTVFDKVSTAIRTTADMLNRHVSCHKNVLNIVSLSHC